MTDSVSLREFLDDITSYSLDGEPEPDGPPLPVQQAPIGRVLEIAGSGSQICMNAISLSELQVHGDPSVAMSGQVGSQVKMEVGKNWLIANVRTMKVADSDDASISAHIDFLGEGTRDAVTGVLTLATGTGAVQLFRGRRSAVGLLTAIAVITGVPLIVRGHPLLLVMAAVLLAGAALLWLPPVRSRLRAS